MTMAIETLYVSTLASSLAAPLAGGHLAAQAIVGTATAAGEDARLTAFLDAQFAEEIGQKPQLAARLGRRDFFREMTKEDEAEMDKTGWLPERIGSFLATYETEFESYGVERMMIDQNAPIPAALLEEEN
jgi:hypothetical protein